MKYDVEARARIMRAVKDRDTKPEMIVRRLVHGMGYRYRLHRKDLPGKPDLVFPRRQKIIFVHGCFWHQHECRRGSRVPKSNREYWKIKLQRNKQRDAFNKKKLEEMGWDTFVIWECETHAMDSLEKRIKSFVET